MSQLIIEEPLASRIREVAKKDGFTPEEMLNVLMERYSPKPRPASSLTDDDIEVPDDIVDEQERAEYRDAVREVRPKLYRIARRYWSQVNDQERLRLSDEQLDKVFWLIDHEGVPRFKAEKGTITLPHDPLEDLIGLFADSDVKDASTSVRETIAQKYARPD